MTRKLKKEALRLSSLGWRIFPLHEPTDGCSCGRKTCQAAGKHPRTHNGLNDATNDPNQIGEWWERWPSANIGLRTGSGLVVIDIDGQDGEDSIHKLRLPPTVESHTGRGRHLFFQSDQTVRSSRGRIGKGIDVRGEGGYVVLPPSVHATGKRYRWKTTPWRYEEARLPPTIEQVICAVSQPSRNTVGGETAQKLNEGGGDDLDYSRSGRDARWVLDMVREGLSRAVAFALFAARSDKYKEKLAYGDDVAERYFAYTYGWAERKFNENLHRARVRRAALEVLGAREGRPPLARVILDLLLIDGEGWDSFEYQLAVPADVTSNASMWDAAAPDLDPKLFLKVDGYKHVRAFEGRLFYVALRRGRVVWARPAP